MPWSWEGLASHCPRVTDISGSPTTGSSPGRGRWAPPPLALLWSTFTSKCAITPLTTAHMIGVINLHKSRVFVSSTMWTPWTTPSWASSSRSAKEASGRCIAPSTQTGGQLPSRSFLLLSSTKTKGKVSAVFTIVFIHSFARRKYTQLTNPECKTRAGQ